MQARPMVEARAIGRLQHGVEGIAVAMKSQRHRNPGRTQRPQDQHNCCAVVGWERSRTSIRRTAVRILGRENVKAGGRVGAVTVDWVRSGPAMGIPF